MRISDGVNNLPLPKVSNPGSLTTNGAAPTPQPSSVPGDKFEKNHVSLLKTSTTQTAAPASQASGSNSVHQALNENETRLQYAGLNVCDIHLPEDLNCVKWTVSSDQPWAQPYNQGKEPMNVMIRPNVNKESREATLTFKGPDGSVLFTRKVIQPAPDKPMNMVGLGDSFSAGTGAHSPDFTAILKSFPHYNSPADYSPYIPESKTYDNSGRSSLSWVRLIEKILAA
ncbi:MAG: hypothetical protein FWD46_09500 [Cystobacterineae bacterium]|nr:hypothetical protein [Cystobacterineae bacterium]